MSSKTAVKYSSKQVARPNRELKFVKLGLMMVSPVAQRRFKASWANRLRLEMDLDKLGTLELSYRGGHYYIVDGQHRFEALKLYLAPGWEDQLLECWVATGLTEEQEADRFLGLNDDLNVDAFEKFKVALVAGRKPQVEIACIVNSLRLVISKDEIPGAVGAVGTLLRVYKRNGPECLRRALAITRDAYGDGGMEAKIIDGLGLLCGRYNSMLGDEEAIKSLSNMHGGVNGLLGEAEVIHRRTGHPKYDCVAAAAAKIINRQRSPKSKLPNWFAGQVSE